MAGAHWWFRAIELTGENQPELSLPSFPSLPPLDLPDSLKGCLFPFALDADFYPPLSVEGTGNTGTRRMAYSLSPCLSPQKVSCFSPSSVLKAFMVIGEKRTEIIIGAEIYTMRGNFCTLCMLRGNIIFQTTHCFPSLKVGIC